MGPAQLLRQLGEPLARDYIQLRRRAVERVAEFAGNHCDIVRIPAFQYSESEKDEDQLKENFEAAEQLGLEVAWRSSIPFPQAQVGYEISGNARIDPAKYLKRLADLAIERGVSIFEQTLVTAPSDKDAHVTPAGEVGTSTSRSGGNRQSLECGTGRTNGDRIYGPPISNLEKAED